jgi:hypothetical protein
LQKTKENKENAVNRVVIRQAYHNETRWNDEFEEFLVTPLGSDWFSGFLSTYDYIISRLSWLFFFIANWGCFRKSFCLLLHDWSSGGPPRRFSPYYAARRGYRILTIPGCAGHPSGWHLYSK